LKIVDACFFATYALAKETEKGTQEVIEIIEGGLISHHY